MTTLIEKNNQHKVLPNRRSACNLISSRSLDQSTTAPPRLAYDLRLAGQLPVLNLFDYPDSAGPYQEQKKIFPFYRHDFSHTPEPHHPLVSETHHPGDALMVQDDGANHKAHPLA